MTADRLRQAADRLDRDGDYCTRMGGGDNEADRLHAQAALLRAVADERGQWIFPRAVDAAADALTDADLADAILGPPASYDPVSGDWA